ncbi:MAG: alpha/beta hydrolase family protein [Pirellulaceae bacterium]
MRHKSSQKSIPYRIQEWSLVIIIYCLCFGLTYQVNASERTLVKIKSSADGTDQPCYLILPTNYESDDVKRPLLVSLHSWSADLNQRNESLEKLADEKGWIYLFPNFRGANRTPQACGSELAQTDILAATEWAKSSLRVDTSRVYLTGVSGGGHMTMLMASRYPEQWTAASAWVGISDLALWYKKHADTRYGEMMRKSCGGAYGDSSKVNKEYIKRSPKLYLKKAPNIALDIAAGIHDGHTGSVPITHSIFAFNAIARANSQPGVSSDEIKQLSKPTGRLNEPLKSDQETDESLGREIHLRRYAGNSRLTIFEGGHEGISTAAISWLEKHKK